MLVLVERKGRHKGRFTLTPDMLDHLGIRKGDKVCLTPMPDGSVILKAADAEANGSDEREG